jgi:RNA 3'-terminal phosphate cyclase (ATP)
MTDDILIDGAAGEGGGQVLRTSLALSLVTGRTFRIERIRARRPKPGLLRQHLTAVQAAAAVSGARVTGAELGSRELRFEPSPVRAGDYRFAVGTAGSATLVFQTVFPALLCATAPSTLVVEGGTHNPQAPTFEFLAKTFLPLLRRMGARVNARLEAYGFYPAGGGRFVVEIEPSGRLQPLTLNDRGPVQVSARALVASLPETIARRELSIIRERLGLERLACRPITVDGSRGPGNVVTISLESEHVTEVVTGFGVKGIAAEKVASDVCDEAARYLSLDVPVGIHLADQLLLPMALGRGGAFRTLKPTPHTETNADVIRRFLPASIEIVHEAAGACRITVGAGATGD